jgi:inosine-uridine nucleoside N-ribohydrolase
MGNDIDDALALSVIHALESRGECRLLGVTLTKDNPWAAPFVDVVNTFYGRGGVPVGVVRPGKTPEDGDYIRAVAARKKADGSPLYPHDLADGGAAPEAVGLLRKLLASQPDRSTVIVQVGFSTNLARLLDSKPDEASNLSGRELVARKVRLLSIMAGAFPPLLAEYNVKIDLDASTKLFAEWPTPLVASGFEIGRAILYPAVSIERDYRYVEHHPVADAYRAYQQMPYDRPTWDLTSVLYAVRPDRGYFDVSPPGQIRVDQDGFTRFTPDKEGLHRFLTVNEAQRARVLEALIQLASQPPDGRKQ